MSETQELFWYMVRVHSGRERKFARTLERRIKEAAMGDKISRVLVPQETIQEIGGPATKKTRTKPLFAGYLMLEGNLEPGEEGIVDKRTEDVWYLVRETPGFGDFVGGSRSPDGKFYVPPMGEAEVSRILGRMEESEERPRLNVNFGRGDIVKVKEGPFESFEAVVDEVNEEKGTVVVSVSIFGRATTVELDYWQVEVL